MLRKSHIITSQAITTGILSAGHVNLPFILASMCGVWLGAQLPDVDNGNTKINHKLGFIGKLLGHIKHRTWTHTIWMVIILGIIAIKVPITSFFNIKMADPPITLGPITINNYLRAFLLFTVWGYFLHLVEDNFSKQGVNFLYPFGHYKITRYGTPCKKRPYRSWYYRTGGTEEKYIRWFMTAIFVLEILQLFIRYYLEN